MASTGTCLKRFFSFIFVCRRGFIKTSGCSNRDFFFFFLVEKGSIN